MYVDIRTNKKVIHLVGKVRAGCICVSCSWKGYRVVFVRKNMGAVIDEVSLSDKIRNKGSYPNCCRCGKEVVFTHATGRC